MGLQAIADGLVQAIGGSVSGLRAVAWRPDDPKPPMAAVCMPSRVDYQGTFGDVGLTTFTIPLEVYVSRMDGPRGQAALAEFMDAGGARALKAAIEADLTLGGACDTLLVLYADTFGVYPFGNVDYLGFRLTVQVEVSEGG